MNIVKNTFVAPNITSDIISNKHQQSRINHWDNAYQRGTPIWDRDYVSPLLEKAINTNLIIPCRVISIGCGTGTNEIYLASKGFKVTAIDLSETALNIACKKATLQNVTIEWICADILNLPDSISDYDLIFDRGCYHNIRYYYIQEYIDSLCNLANNNTKCLIISCNSSKPPGVTSEHIKNDCLLSKTKKLDIEHLEEIKSVDHNGNKRNEWLTLITINSN